MAAAAVARRVSAPTNDHVRPPRRRPHQRPDAVEEEVDPLLRRKAAKEDKHRRLLASASASTSTASTASAASAAASAPVRRRPRSLQRGTPVH